MRLLGHNLLQHALVLIINIPGGPALDDLIKRMRPIPQPIRSGSALLAPNFLDFGQ